MENVLGHGKIIYCYVHVMNAIIILLPSVVQLILKTYNVKNRPPKRILSVATGRGNGVILGNLDVSVLCLKSRHRECTTSLHGSIRNQL